MHRRGSSSARAMVIAEHEQDSNVAIAEQEQCRRREEPKSCPRDFLFVILSVLVYARYGKFNVIHRTLSSVRTCTGNFSKGIKLIE